MAGRFLTSLSIFLCFAKTVFGVSEFAVYCNIQETCYDFGNSEIYARPYEALEFSNDNQYCDPTILSQTYYGGNQCDNDPTYSGSPYYCSDRTTYLQGKFQDLVNGDTSNPSYDFFDQGLTGCSQRSGTYFSGSEYYRLACNCDAFSSITGYWSVYYYSDNACTNLVAQSLNNPSGYCGAASSVSVSMFAMIACVFAALKTM